MLLKKINLNSIRSKLIISLVSICIIPLIITGFFSYNQSKSMLSNKLTVTSTQTLSEINNGLTDYFTGFTDRVTMIANNYDVVNADTGNYFDNVPGLLKNLKESNKDILTTYYGSASGRFAIYPNSKMQDGYDATKRPWYEQAVQAKGKPVITQPYKSATTGDNVVGIAQAVEKDGEIVGVIGMDCTLSTLAERIATKKIGNSGYVFIADVAW